LFEDVGHRCKKGWNAGTMFPGIIEVAEIYGKIIVIFINYELIWCKMKTKS
jgi:hypothetical protein